MNDQDETADIPPSPRPTYGMRTFTVTQGADDLKRLERHYASKPARAGMGAGLVVPGLLSFQPPATTATFNPAQHFVDAPVAFVELAQQLADVGLSADQVEAAVRIGREACTGSTTPTMRTLVDAWSAEPSLVSFAVALAKAAIPGGLVAEDHQALASTLAEVEKITGKAKPLLDESWQLLGSSRDEP